MLPKRLRLLLLALLATVSAWWLWSQDGADRPAAEQAVRETPAAFMEGMVSRVMDEQGRPRYELQSARMEYFAGDKRTELSAPQVTLFRANGSLWTLNAEQGVARSGDEEIQLQGNVLIRRLADASEGAVAELEIQTRDLRILPDSEYAETDQPTHIIHRLGKVDAVGIRADFKQQRLELLSKVSGRYEPHP